MLPICDLSPAQHDSSFRALPPKLREIWFHPAYNALCARWEKAAAQCIAAGSMLYPFLAHSIDDTFDAQTAYGYGGPIFTDDWPTADRVAALNHCGQHLRDAGAVAEFIRCHPHWCDTAALAAAGYRVFQVRTNVECELTAGDFTQSWASGARRNLRKAQASGLTFAIRPSMEVAIFAALYDQTAQRLNMSAFYRFDRAYFDALCALEQSRLIIVQDDATPVAAAIVLLGGELAFYHLGASDFAHQHLRPNDFLYFAMATVARDAGCKKIIWGGGMSNDPADSLFRFKSHFGAIHTPVYCAGRILDQTKFDRLHESWQKRNPGKESRLFLKYRA